MLDTDLAEWGSAQARRTLAVCVLGSSIAFVDATVVNVALPHIAADLHTGLAGLQWVVNAYLVTLTALVLVGGALGDRYGRRRMFLTGIYAFSAASVAAGAAPTIGALLAARAAQGVAAALLVPGSLSLLTATVKAEDRARAVGAWAGLTGVAGAVGPFLGGWLVDALSWRWVFFINLPLAAIVIMLGHGVVELSAGHGDGRIDVAGGALAAAGLGLITFGIINHQQRGAVVALVIGAVLAVAFVVTERRSSNAMMPPSLFTSTQFSGANAITLMVYAGFGVATFLVVLDLQNGLGYSALEAGAALTPVTMLLLLLSSRVGALAQRTGPTVLMVTGPVLAGVGLALLSGLEPGDRYLANVLPGTLVLGLGLACTVAPLTAVVMASVDDAHLGTASGINNAAARLASLIGVALVPSIAGVRLTGPPGAGVPGYRTALLIAGALCVAGGAIAALTIRRAARVHPTAQPALHEPCRDPCVVHTGTT
jgi:EmrB/QacA subfamily drug resistance transporter